MERQKVSLSCRRSYAPRIAFKTMLAERRGRGADRVGSDAPWKRSPAREDFREYANQYRRQRKASRQRSTILGLETRSELIWEDWDVGKEYTKTLIIKNVHNKLQKLRFRPPESGFFVTSINLDIFASPGTSFSVPITFRPHKKFEYEDNIEIQSKDGTLRVCLHATLPYLSLEMPGSVLLPVCAVQHASHTLFQLKNTSKLQTRFQWEFSAPFQLSPQRGLLLPGQTCQINVDFRPLEALVFQQQATCKFGEEGREAESCCAVILQGLAKHPCLQLRNLNSKDEDQWNDVMVDFGNVTIGQSLKKYFVVFNPSPTATSFSLSHVPGVLRLGSEFTCDITVGKVAPGGSVKAAVTYTPNVADTVSVEYLSLEYKGALNKSQVKLYGRCIGLQVSLSSSVVNFGCVRENEGSVKMVDIINSSPVEAFFQWDFDCSGHSVFSIQPACGAIPPKSRKTLKLSYNPPWTLTHHRRVACFILHGEPVMLDLVGTCHSDPHQSDVIRPDQLVLSSFQNTFEELSNMQHEWSVEVVQQGASHSSQEEQDQNPGSDPVTTTPLSPPVTVTPHELVFNRKLPTSRTPSSSSSQAVAITNHTNVTLNLVWTMAKDSPFSVTPTVFDLPPLKSNSFRVFYNPKELNTLHGAQLECFAYYKNEGLPMGERLPYLPCCVTVRLSGHSFQPDQQRFVPRCSLRPQRLVFPGVSVLTYKTALLHNEGDQPVIFCVSPELTADPDLAAQVSIMPSSGFLRAGEHQILILRTTPAEDHPQKGFNVALQLNAGKHKEEIAIFSGMEKVCVLLDRDNTLYFQPTHVGSYTQRTHRIKNVCHLPVRFEWRIPEPAEELIIVEPHTGELQPNDAMVQTWFFHPKAENMYIFNTALIFWPALTPGKNKSQLPLKLMGRGSKGCIEAKSAVINVGDTVVGSSLSVDIPLINKSPCPITFSLSVQEKLPESQPGHSPPEPAALQLNLKTATFPPLSTMILNSTFRPRRRALYLWTISYQTLDINGIVLSAPEAVCEVQGEGVFPTLQVMDACSEGSVDGLNKVHVWKLFSLDSLNAQLVSNPSPAELLYRSQAKQGPLSSTPSILATTIVDFNFVVAPHNSEPSTFVLMFHNPGCIPVDWTFLFPEDQKIQLDYWAETGEFSEIELHQMKVQENQIFDVSPRSGSLLPGQKSAVCFIHRHTYVGTDQLPVIFKLSYGREILLNFHGMTVGGDRPHLYHLSDHHVFTSVPAGDLTPPVQMYEVYNGGALPVCYEVDAAALAELQDKNFNHPVLCCLTPVGRILPGNVATLEFIFFPLEEKTYYMDIPIHIQGGESTMVKFEANGGDCSSRTGAYSDASPLLSYPKRVPFPKQMAFLSEDNISLGDISVCSHASRILFLTNVSHKQTICYSWDRIQQSSREVLQIDPQRGRLPPGESVLFILSFTAPDYPTIFQFNIICQYTPEAAVAQYNHEMQRWEEEKEREKYEFTITEADVAEASGGLRKGPRLRKYTTLPPISVSRGGEPAPPVERKRELPKPPKPTLLHLVVTARSHGPLVVKRQIPEATPCNTPLPPTDSLADSTAVHVLTSVFRDLLDDEPFIRFLMSLEPRPVSFRCENITTSLGCTPSSSTTTPLTEDPSPEDEAKVEEQPVTVATVDTDETLDTLETMETLETLETLETVETTELQSSVALTPPAQRMPLDMSEDILLNTIQNLMMEVIRGELVLTTRPRGLVLPPLSPRMLNNDAAQRSPAGT